MGDDKLKKYLSKGGQRVMRHDEAGEIFSVHGPDLKRETAAGGHTLIPQLLSPKLDLTPVERAIGNCYGAYYEAAHTGGSTEFLREFVDGGGVAGAGYSERQAMVVSMVQEAQRALRACPAVVYAPGRPRKGGKAPGRHEPIRAQVLIDFICVYGYTTTTVAARFQWFVYRENKRAKVDSENKYRCIVPDRQRKHLFAGLKENLNVIGDAWQSAGMAMPYGLSNIEVE